MAGSADGVRAALILAGLLPIPAGAAVLEVGEGAQYKSLAAAARAAKDGDTIRLAAGEYFECAAFTQRDLVLEGVGAETVITDKTCEGKALLISRGDNLTVRDLVLTRARVPDQNGAGIRLEGQGLTVERVRFDNNQVGVLGGQGPGQVIVRECAFHGGGIAGKRPTYALMVGEAALLRVERSVFEEVRGGMVTSAARQTELTGNRLSSGVEEGAAAVVRVTGHLVMQDNDISLGPQRPANDAAVIAIGNGAELRGNRLRNNTGRSMTLLLDWMDRVPMMDGNALEPGDSLVSTSGSWWYKASGAGHAVVDGVRGAAGGAKRAVRGIFGQ